MQTCFLLLTTASHSPGVASLAWLTGQTWPSVVLRMVSSSRGPAEAHPCASLRFQAQRERDGPNAQVILKPLFVCHWLWPRPGSPVGGRSCKATLQTRAGAGGVSGRRPPHPLASAAASAVLLVLPDPLRFPWETGLRGLHQLGFPAFWLGSRGAIEGDWRVRKGSPGYISGSSWPHPLTEVAIPLRQACASSSHSLGPVDCFLPLSLCSSSPSCWFPSPMLIPLETVLPESVPKLS